MSKDTTIRVTGGCLGNEFIFVKCNLTQPSAPVLVDYDNEEGWQHTQYQCADARNRYSGLVRIARELAANAVSAPEEHADDCDIEEVDV